MASASFCMLPKCSKPKERKFSNTFLSKPIDNVLSKCYIVLCRSENHHYKKVKKNEELFQMDKNLTVTKLSWRKVAERVSQISGKPYSAQYVREVAIGYRSNKQLTSILQDLGLVKKEVA